MKDLSRKILSNPQDYLHVEHDEKKPINPSTLYSIKKLDNLCPKEDFIEALREIREVATKRGHHEDKPLVWASIEGYLEYVSPMLRNPNHVDLHIKGLYGCVLPKHMREKARQLTTRLTNVETTPSVKTTDKIKVNLGEVSFSLTKGSSIVIGEVKTQTLDFKGLSHVKIEKVSEGKLYGLTLTA